MTELRTRAGGDYSTFLDDETVDLSPPTGAGAGRRWLVHLSRQANGGLLTARRLDGGAR